MQLDGEPGGWSEMVAGGGGSCCGGECEVASVEGSVLVQTGLDVVGIAVGGCDSWADLRCGDNDRVIEFPIVSSAIIGGVVFGVRMRGLGDACD